jgi:hypothetical protein
VERLKCRFKKCSGADTLVVSLTGSAFIGCSTAPVKPEIMANASANPWFSLSQTARSTEKAFFPPFRQQ